MIWTRCSMLLLCNTTKPLRDAGVQKKARTFIRWTPRLHWSRRTISRCKQMSVIHGDYLECFKRSGQTAMDVRTTRWVKMVIVQWISWVNIMRRSTDGRKLNNVWVNCACAKFEQMDLSCKHALFILQKKKVNTLPNHYILDRWTLKVSSLIFQGLCQTIKISTRGFSDESLYNQQRDKGGVRGATRARVWFHQPYVNSCWA